MCLLLIDDELQVIGDLTRLLRDRFHIEAISWIENRERLLASLDAFEQPPTLVILDFQMDPPGDEVYVWLKEWNPDLHVVFYTRFADTPDRRLRMERAGAGGAQIVEKRSTPRDVLKLLRALGR
ncbi:MAG: response regulator [Acidobacteriota bacterium]